MKKILSILLVAISANTYGQSCNTGDPISGFTIPCFAQIQLSPSRDTICWYWNRDEVIAYVATQGFGSGTVTSITAGSGLSGGTITTSGTVSADTSILGTKAYRQKAVDSLNALIAAKGTGTVTSASVVTANGFSGSVATSTTTPAITISQTSIGSAVTATTQTAGDNSTKIATTAYVDNAGIYYTQVSLTSAQILTMNSVPVQLVAAPGSGMVIVPIAIIMDYTYGTATYGSGGAVQVYETSDKSGPISVTAAINNNSASKIQMFGVTGTAGGGWMSLSDNQPLMVWMASANPITGDGTAKFNIYYRIMTR